VSLSIYSGIICLGHLIFEEHFEHMTVSACSHDFLQWVSNTNTRQHLLVLVEGDDSP